ncbi:hypothetical protein CRG98_012191 [Punica granatum]|uniref:Agenet domain-containing protein n=1 Tax=Punica granatum TaxID=22663 RepID=A0A2I0KHW9_PUNGR|nr:hypothetical protein CRG98_012191 [Punica granatum]
MVRPRFPLVRRKSEKINIDDSSELTVIAEDQWKEGDLVDWWKDNCYWSGRVTKVLDNEKVQIELPRPPEGEGDTWDAYSKDLRPSLEWSPETGWTLPTIKVGKHNRHCAQLIKPLNEGVQKTHSSDSVTGFDIQEDKEKEAAPALEELKSESTIRLNSMFSNTLEGAVLDLETLATRFRMLQDILEFGVLPETGQFSLKIPQSRAPPMWKRAPSIRCYPGPVVSMWTIIGPICSTCDAQLVYMRIWLGLLLDEKQLQRICVAETDILRKNYQRGSVFFMSALPEELLYNVVTS